jgi:hypothetical protein
MLAIALMSINAATGSGCALFCCICQDNSDLQWSTKALSLGCNLHFPESCHSNYPHFSVDILLNISQIILYAPIFGIHVKTETTHKDIGLKPPFLQPVNGYVFPLQVAIDPQYACIEKPGKGTTSCRRCHVEHASSILYAFASSIYMSMRLLPQTNSTQNQFEWLIMNSINWASFCICWKAPICVPILSYFDRFCKPWIQWQNVKLFGPH